MSTLSPALWRKAYDALRPKDKDVIPTNFATKPEDLVLEVEKYISQSKGKLIKLHNGENLCVRDVLQKVSRWIKKFVEVGDTVIQYDPGHAALPWALLRLVLQISMNNIEKHAAVLEGIEQISYYLVWCRIEEANLAIPFEAHDQLELVFIHLYTTILTFTARAVRFLHDKSRKWIKLQVYKSCADVPVDRIVAALFSSSSKFQDDVEQMARYRQSIESYAQQISNQTNQLQYDEILSVKKHLADLDQPMIRIEQTTQSISSAIDRIENQLILDWASQIPFQKHFRLAREKALPGTGKWLFQDPEFSTWHSCSRSQILWLYGSAGSGKSTLISMVAQSLIKEHEQMQAPYPIFFFCSRNTAEPERADPEHILRCLMRQASDLPGGPPLHRTLRDRFDKRRTEGDVSAEEASEIFINTIEDRPITYIIVDALDECNRGKREILIDGLKTILAQSNSLVKIFVTSRDSHQDIVNSMAGFPALCIDASRNQEDIVQYVQHSVQLAIKKRKLLPTERMTDDVRQAIVNSLCNGADGMFRWVELQLEYLCTIRKTSILLTRLERLPPTLEKVYQDLYEYNMQELGEEQAEVVRKLLSWLLVAKRPLRTSEMCQLVCAPDKADMSIETVLDMTFDLVRLDTEQDSFRFSHLSAREFLEKRENEFGQNLLHNMATSTCLILMTDPDATDTKGYAAIYWPSHAEDATRSDGGKAIKEQVDEFLRTHNSHFKRWSTDTFEAKLTRREMSLAQRRLFQSVAKSGTPLLIAACFNLSTQLQRIIADTEELVDIELKNQRGDSVLILASKYGAAESVHILLDNGADINAQGEYSFTALHQATNRGHEKVVQILLDRGANVNARDQGKETALHRVSAMGYGHEKLVSILLKGGADVNAGDEWGLTPLYTAITFGHEKTASMLLGAGADINASTVSVNAGLLSASCHGHEEIVKLLLGKGVDVNARNEDGETALFCASRGGQKKIVQLLLDVGADLNAQICDEITQMISTWNNAPEETSTGGYLIISSQPPDLLRGREEVAQLLLQRVPNRDGDNKASQSGNEAPMTNDGAKSSSRISPST